MERQILAKLEWERGPARELVRLGWPIAVSMLSYSLMTLVDTMFVGHLGATALAGVSLGAVLTFVTIVFGIGLVRGGKTLIAQAIGAGRPEEFGAYLGATLLLGGLYSVLALAGSQGIVLALSAWHPDAAHVQAASYMQVRMLGTPLVIAYMALREARYGKGDARSPMFATIVANLANVGLNVLFVVILKKGVVGSATATVLAQAVEALILVYVQQREGFFVRSMRRSHVKALFAIGVPSGLHFVLEFGAFALLATIVSAMGEVQMAAHQIALQVIHFSFLPAFALGEAASVLAGNAVGAQREELVMKVARAAMWIGGAYTGFCTLVFALFAGSIGAIFTDDTAVREVARSLLLIASLFQIADAANMVARGVLRGVGDVRVPAVVGVVTAWVMSPPLAWLLGVVFHLGARGAWIGLTAEIFIGAGIIWWRLARGQWLAVAHASRESIMKSDAPAPLTNAVVEEAAAE